MRTVASNASYSTANDEGLQKVVEKWLPRTPRERRTWQTLLEVTKVLDEHELSKYLEKNKIPSE